MNHKTFKILSVILIAVVFSIHSERIYMNPQRGFAAFNSPIGTTLDIDNSSDSIISRNGYFQLNSSDFYFSWNIKSINNAEGKYYKFSGTDRLHKVSHPAWQLAIKTSSGNGYAIRFATVNTDPNGYEPIYAMRVSLHKLRTNREDDLIKQTDIKHVDLFTGCNIFKLQRKGTTFSLTTSSANDPIIEWNDEAISVNNISFCAEPGARLCISRAILDIATPETLYTHNISLDSIISRLSAPNDELEGIWSYLDREMEESMLRMGGNYDIALINNGNGYDMIYIAGATTCASRWKTGMLKGKLIPSKFKGIYDVVWNDAEHKPMHRHLSASFKDNTFLTLSFPYQNTTIRFMKLSSDRAQDIIQSLKDDR